MMTRAAIAALTLALTVPAPAAAQARQGAKPSPATPDRALLLQQAADALKAGRAADAAGLLRTAAERYESVQAYIELARLQSRAGDAPAALESLTKARAIAPNSEDVLAAYAQLALAAKQSLPAVLTLESMTRLYPTVAQYHYLLGVGLMGIGEMPAAADSLTEADRLEPDKPLTLLALGLVQNNRKLYAEAKTALARSLELQPESPDALAALAEAEAGLGDLDNAAAHAQRVLDRVPGHAVAHLVLGIVLMERRSYTEARDRLLKAAEADPDSPKPAYQLSLVFARLGDDASSQKYLAIYREKSRAFEDRLRASRTLEKK